MTKKRKGEKSPDERVEQDAEGPDAPESLAAERDDLLDRLQRVSADYLNYQKRVARDVDEARLFANVELVKDLLALLDDMERALDAGRENHPAEDPLLTGMQLVYDKALEMLARHGVKPIEAQGQSFDPNRHEAMMQQPCSECEGPMVLEDLQRGYELRGRVIRPSRVIVAMPAAEQPPQADKSESPAEEQ